jgi:predicted  nucleic acid-binding Zn-ribbon protein
MNQDALETFQQLKAAIAKEFADLNETIAQRNGLIESLSARIDYLEAQISAARKALENAQFTEALNILDEAESEGK